MNKDQVEGRYEEAKGAIKEVAGNVLGDESMELRGMVQKDSGKIQADIGDLREKARKDH